MYEEIVEVDERIRPWKSFDQGKKDIKVVEGDNGEKFVVLKEPDLAQVDKDLRKLKEEKKFNSVAIVLMHSYGMKSHEDSIGELAKKLGFS